MYLVVSQMDYESVNVLSAHVSKEQAVIAAEVLIARHDWNGVASRQDLSEASELSPALRAVASWRISDLYTYGVYEVIVS